MPPQAASMMDSRHTQMQTGLSHIREAGSAMRQESDHLGRLAAKFRL
ncbi:hypothetical protein [Marinobacterium sp. MBR-109]